MTTSEMARLVTICCVQSGRVLASVADAVAPPSASMFATMICTFQIPELGRCTVKRQAFGKHGFCAPKFFTVSVADDATLPACTYRFVDNAISGLHSSALHNDTLCRIAIAQFLAAQGEACSADAVPLDLSTTPYAGDVIAPNGKRLRGAVVPAMYQQDTAH